VEVEEEIMEELQMDLQELQIQVEEEVVNLMEVHELLYYQSQHQVIQEF
jgi:hypothetical protein